MLRVSYALLVLSLLGAVSFGETKRPTLAMSRVEEPKEKAFTFLCPTDWKIDGGIFNVNPMQTNGPGNSISPKCDLTVKSDDTGTVMLRWVASWNYADLSFSTMNGLFQPGQMYQGMLVKPMPTCGQFLDELLLTLRPQAQNVKVVAEDSLKEIVEAYESRAAQMNAQLQQIGVPPIHSTALGRVVEYDERGTRFREVLITSLVDARGGAFMWSNSDTIAYRAPVDQFAQWKPAFDVIRTSGQFNPEWVSAVTRAMGERAKSALETQRYIAKVSQEIVEHRRKTNADIRHENWLLLTGQEEYNNPFTGKPERDTSEYPHRWVSNQGGVIYSDENGFDPNKVEQYNTREWKRTPVRPR